MHGHKSDSKSEHKDDKKTQSRDRQKDERIKRGNLGKTEETTELVNSREGIATTPL